MDATPARELSPLERAITAFNAGADPSAAALQRAFLDGKVCVLSSSEVLPDGSAPLHLLAFDGVEGETNLAVFTDADRVDLEGGKKFPWMVNTTGENALNFTTGGITINPGSSASLGVTVKTAGVQEMRDVASARKAAAEARAARTPNEIETAIAAVDREGMDAAGLRRFGVALWPANLLVPSSQPLGSTIDLNTCFTIGPDTNRMVAAFSDRDQLGDFAAPHLLEITGGDLYHRLPAGTGILINPQRPDQLPMTGEGLRIIASLVEGSAPGADSPVAEPPARRGLFRRRT